MLLFVLHTCIHHMPKCKFTEDGPPCGVNSSSVSQEIPNESFGVFAKFLSILRHFIAVHIFKQTPWPLVRERTIPTE
jgi:hypothetical protein